MGAGQRWAAAGVGEGPPCPLLTPSLPALRCGTWSTWTLILWLVGSLEIVCFFIVTVNIVLLTSKRSLPDRHRSQRHDICF